MGLSLMSHQVEHLLIVMLSTKLAILYFHSASPKALCPFNLSISFNNMRLSAGHNSVGQVSYANIV